MKIKAKTYYFADCGWESHFDTIEDEFKMVVANKAEMYGITFENVTCTDLPPFEEGFSILFFDWGGMSMGNSMIDHFCREIAEMAQEYPSKDFIMVSAMTAAAMEDVKRSSEELLALPNIYMSVESYCMQLLKQKP